jgi:hypothetical protein
MSRHDFLKAKNRCGLERDHISACFQLAFQTNIWTAQLLNKKRSAESLCIHSKMEGAMYHG